MKRLMKRSNSSSQMPRIEEAKKISNILYTRDHIWIKKDHIYFIDTKGGAQSSRRD